MKKRLNKKQANMLFNDILNGKVKRLGQFKINKYRLSIYFDSKVNTSSQRVLALYNRRKKKNICVACGKVKVKKYVRCAACRERQNYLRRKK